MAGALELQLCDVFDLVVAGRLFLFLRVDLTSLHFLFKFASRTLVSKAQKSGKSLLGQWRFKKRGIAGYGWAVDLRLEKVNGYPDFSGADKNPQQKGRDQPRRPKACM